MLLRIRTVKPGFFWDEDLAHYPPLCRLFLEGLWCAADKMGRLEDRPMMLQHLILPYEKNEELAGQYLELLASPGPVRGTTYVNRYEVVGKRYIQLLGFLEDHRPGKFEPPSMIPSVDGFVADVEAFNTVVDGKLRKEVYQRDGYKCVYCGADLAAEARKICVDYVIPLMKGGASSRKNLVTSCKKCHGRKGERTPDEAGMACPEGFGEKLPERPFQPSIPLEDGADGVTNPVMTPSNGGRNPVNPPLTGVRHPVDGTLTTRQHTTDQLLPHREHTVNGASTGVNHPLTGQRPLVNGGQRVVNPLLTTHEPPVDTSSPLVNPLLTGGQPPADDPCRRKGTESHGEEMNVDIVRHQPPSPRGQAHSVLGDFEESPEPGSGRQINSSDGDKKNESPPGVIPFPKPSGNGGKGQGFSASGRPGDFKLVVGSSNPRVFKRASVQYQRTEATDEIISYLNRRLGKEYALDGQKSLECVHGRLDEGFTVGQFKIVIDRKAALWKTDPTYSVYLRPQTLFGENFESYLNEIDGSQEQRLKELLAICQSRPNSLTDRRIEHDGFTADDRHRAVHAYFEEVKAAYKTKNVAVLEGLVKEDMYERMRKMKEGGNAG